MENVTGSKVKQVAVSGCFNDKSLIFCREHAISRSSDDLPCSLLLVSEGDEVIGHARISAVVGIPSGVFIESGADVIVFFENFVLW